MSIREFLWRLLAPRLAPEPGPPEPPAVPPGAIRVRFLDAQRPAEPPVDPGGYTVEMEMSLHTVASLFGAHGWQIARPGQGPQPSAVDLAQVLAEMIATLDDQEPDEMSTLYQYARFAAIRSDDFPDDVDLYLHIGTATRNTPSEDDDIDPGELL